MSINIEDLTIGQLKELRQFIPLTQSNVIAESPASELPFEIGKKYLIRTVTMTDIGRAVGYKQVGNQHFLELEDACWVADTGYFAIALKSGFEATEESELEPFTNNAFIAIGAICDFTEWDKELPRDRK